MVTKALHNHAILIIIIVSFFYTTLDLPFTISTYRLGYDYYRTTSFCLWWYWIDDSLIAVSLFLTATASVQRYFLLFKSHLLRIRRTRWILHYIPLILSIIYPPLFYFVVIVFYPCQNLRDNASRHCVSPCYTLNSILIIIHWMLHSVLPLIVIIFAHAILVSWMIYSMRTLNREQSLIWKKQKKLILQLLAFSLLYVAGWTPSTIVSGLQAFSLNDLSEKRPSLVYVYYMSYFICPLQPFICLLVLPEPFYFIKYKVKQILTRAIVRPVSSIQPGS